MVDLSSSEMSSADSVPLMHSPTNTPNDKIYSSLRLAPRMTIFPASAKKSWSQADEAMELMLQAECPAFKKMSSETMMSNLINVIKTYFSKPHEPEQTKPRPSRPHEHCCVLTLLVENRTEPEMGSRSELLLFISERKVGYTHTRKWRHASIE